MTDSCHLYPCSDKPGIGHLILDMIISIPLFSIENDIHIWNGNAPEQLDALVASHLRSKGVSEDEIAKL